MIANMDAILVRRSKRTLTGGYIVEIVIWRVPLAVPGSQHPFKYRLYFGKAGRRLIAYDNERGKGDHKHIDGTELPYAFTDLNQLEADFYADVARWRMNR